MSRRTVTFAFPLVPEGYKVVSSCNNTYLVIAPEGSQVGTMKVEQGHIIFELSDDATGLELVAQLRQMHKKPV